MANSDSEPSDQRPQQGETDDPEYAEAIARKERILTKILNPFETGFLYFQRVLVWEKPTHSAVLMFLVNGAFWLATSTNYRFFFLLAMCAMVAVCAEIWRNRIWPTIRVENPEEDQDSWAVVHPRLLSAPELAHHIAEGWVAFAWSCKKLWEMKKNSPGKFTALVCVSCGAMALVGIYIPGVMIAYIIVMSLLLWPCVEYHRVIQRIYNRFEPLMMQLDYSMKTRRGRSGRKKRKRMHTGRVSLGVGQSTSHATATAETDDSETDTELGQFIPRDPETTAALARALTDSEMSEDEASSLAQFSRAGTPSIAEDNHTDNEGTFMEGLSEFPSFNDPSMLAEEDENLGIPPGMQDISQEEQESEDYPAGHMMFDPTHFDGEDEPPRPTARQRHRQGQAQTDVIEMARTQIVREAATTVVQQTLTALGNMATNWLASAASSTDDQPSGGRVNATSRQDSTAQQQPRVRELSPHVRGPKRETEFSDSEIEDDFEFLDQEDFESYNDQAGNSPEGASGSSGGNRA
ncbi:reticulophagy regulator 3-like isoform X1 [Branchiostoma floridae x Branchiostoma japonicum]